MVVGFACSHGDIEHLCGLLVGVAVDPVQHEYLSRLVRQLGDGLFKIQATIGVVKRGRRFFVGIGVSALPVGNQWKNSAQASPRSNARK